MIDGWDGGTEGRTDGQTDRQIVVVHRSLFQIMHHPVHGINSLVHSVSLASHVSTHLLIHLSAHLCHHYYSHHPSLLHSFTQGSKPTFSTNPSRLNTSSTLDCFHDHGTGPDSYFSIYF